MSTKVILDPQQIGPYRIVRKLGSGGMGEVFLAEDPRLNRMVALKLLPQEISHDPDRIDRLQREARAVSALNHPNILTIYEIGVDDDRHFIASEYIDGETLRVRMMRRLTLIEALDIAVGIADALTASHQAALVHRDIKPENVMLRPDGFVKVLDFGISKLLTTDARNDEETAQRLETDPGMVKGTVLYMSPEQLRGEDIDARSDIFSLGIVVYEMVAGASPFSAASSAEVIAAILDREPRPLGFYREDIPFELERIVSKSLRKDRRERYQTVRDVRLDLQSLKQELEFAAREQRTSGSVNRASGSVRRRSATGEVVVSWDQPTRMQKFWKGPFVFAIPLLAIAGAILGFFLLRGQSEGIKSIAVLPFATSQGDADSDYLSEGISESIIHSLSRLPDVKVMASSSVGHYRGKDIDPAQVGRELAVRAVLTGRLRRRGDLLLVQTDLVDASNGALIWGDQYERKSADVLALQEDIAHEVSGRLSGKLSNKERRQLVRRSTENPGAYRLYIEGRHHWNKRTAEGIQKGIEAFSKAIDLDPAYSLAYAGLADCYSIQSQYGGPPPTVTFPRARAAAERALALDDENAEAHTSLGYIHFVFDRDWKGAEQEYRRSIALNPSYPTAHHWLALYLAAMGRMPESVTEMRQAYALDPLSPVISMNVGSILYLSGQYDEALQQFSRTAEMDPTFTRVHYEMARVLEIKDRFDEAYSQMKLATSLEPPFYEAAMARLDARSGQKARALQSVQHLIERRATAHVSPYDIAGIYTALDDHKSAMFWLEQAFDMHLGRLAYLRVEPMFIPLHGDPEFRQLLQKVGLPPLT